MSTRTTTRVTELLTMLEFDSKNTMQMAAIATEYLEDLIKKDDVSLRAASRTLEKLLLSHGYSKAAGTLRKWFNTASWVVTHNDGEWHSTRTYTEHDLAAGWGWSWERFCNEVPTRNETGEKPLNLASRIKSNNTSLKNTLVHARAEVETAKGYKKKTAQRVVEIYAELIGATNEANSLYTT